MSLQLSDPRKVTNEIQEFLQSILAKTKTSRLVVAVSGGIDSAVSLTMAVKAAGAEHVYPVFLPYKEQSITDSITIAEWNHIPKENWREVNIGQVVDTFQESLKVSDDLRLGNIMARTRMIVVFDVAKELGALVCGTENKSEKYLGYFTRFGDEASDIEPLQSLYKTQVRQVAEYLQLPLVFLEKAPSAGLWQGQTDEAELGFSYEAADQALAQLIDGESVSDVSPDVLHKVKARVTSQAFKLQVPYKL